MTQTPYYRTDGHYHARAPFFFAVETFPAAVELSRQWQVIRAEYEANVARGTDHVVAVFNPAGPPVPGWSSVNFQTYMWRFHPARRAYPRLAGLLDSIPGLVSAYINVLEPHSSIEAHEGDSDAIVRFHLGLDVPAGDCGVRVGSETRNCSNGTMFGFNDAHWHSSWNATDARRVVLVFDVMRPEYLPQQRWICANVIAAIGIVFLEARLNRRRDAEVQAMHKAGRTVPLPQPIRTWLRRLVAVGVYFWLPIQRRWG